MLSSSCCHNKNCEKFDVEATLHVLALYVVATCWNIVTSKNILYVSFVVPMVLSGEPLVLSCTPMLLIGRTNKSHEVVPSNCKGGSLAHQCGYLSLHVGWVNWSERININRGVTLLICDTLSLV